MRLSKDKGQVEDRRGKSATSLSVFRRRTKSLIPDTISAVAKAQEKNFARKMEPVIKLAKEMDRPRSPEEAADRVSRDREWRKREKAMRETRSFFSDILKPKPTTTDKEASKEISKAYRVAIKPPRKGLLESWLTAMPAKKRKEWRQ
jgi:hypothetical protein